MNKVFLSDFSPSFNSPVQKPSKILQSAGIYHQSLFLYHILFSFIETTGSTLTLLGWVLIVIYWTIPVIQCILSTQILHCLQFIKVALYMLPYEYFYEVISPKIVAIIEKNRFQSLPGVYYTKLDLYFEFQFFQFHVIDIVLLVPEMNG